MTSPTKPRTPALYHAGDGAPASLGPPAAIAITAGAVGTFYLLAGLLPRELALVVGQLAQGSVALGAAWLFAAAGPRGAAHTLGLVRPRWIHVVAALLLGVSCWYIDLRIVDLLPGLDTDGGDAHALTDLVRDPSLAASLVTLALVPALCEELVFRGVLARGLTPSLPPVAAAAIAAVLFSAYHLSPLQAVPAFLLGLVLGVLALRARSIVPAMLAHALNNTFVIAVSRDDSPGGAASWLDGHPWGALAGAVLLAGTGLAIVVGARPA